jgi:ribulose bisphosphate carboxylase small subunit
MWQLIDSQILEGPLKILSDCLSTPEGWLVRTVVTNGNQYCQVVQTFVPDPMHSWKFAPQDQEPEE